MKSPTTVTRVALGAQTAKRTPLTPSTVIGLRAEAMRQFEMPAFVEQMKIDVAEQRGRMNRGLRFPGRASGQMIRSR